MFYITFGFCYLCIYRFFSNIFKINKPENNIFLIILFGIKESFNILISIIIFIMLVPLLLIWTPFFPLIIAIVNGF